MELWEYRVERYEPKTWFVASKPDIGKFDMDHFGFRAGCKTTENRTANLHLFRKMLPLPNNVFLTGALP